MKLTVSVLAHHLRGQYPGLLEVPVPGAGHLVERALLLEGMGAREDAIWLARWEQLRKLEALPQSLVCVGGGEDARVLFAARAVEALVLPESANMALLYQAVCGVFFHYDSFEREVTSAIIAGEDLPALLNRVSRMFASPVFVTDAALRVLAHSEVDGGGDSMWQATLEEGISHQQVMTVMKETGMIDRLNTTTRAIYVDQPPVEPFFSANFIQEGTRLASLTVASHQSELDERLAPVVDGVVALLAPVVYRAGDPYYLQSSNLLKMMLDMLGGAMLDRRVLQHNLSLIRWDIADEYQLLKVELDERDIAGGTAKYTQELAKKMFPDSMLVDLRDAFVLVLHRNGHPGIDDTLTADFQKLLAGRKGKAGASMRYYDFSRLAAAYRLAGVALEKGEILAPKKALHHYEDYVTADLIDLCALSTDVESLCHPEAVRLFRHDQAHNSEFMDSLYMYLVEERHLAAAAKRLNIHRNTLVYRLSRLQDICPMDLDDSRLRLHLMWSCQVLRHLHPKDRDAEGLPIWAGY